MELKERFFVMAGRVEQLGAKIDPANVNSLKGARKVLGDIIADLQGMVSLGEVRGGRTSMTQKRTEEQIP